MTSELPQQPLTPEELAQRRKKVRNVVLLRAFLFGLMVAAAVRQPQLISS